MSPRDRLAAALAELLDAMDDVVRERVAEELSAVPARAAVPPWLSVKQAAERLDCSPDAVRMRAKRGRLESRYQGRRLYVSRASVDALG